jgi:hypothetical protein
LEPAAGELEAAASAPANLEQLVEARQFAAIYCTASMS